MPLAASACGSCRVLSPRALTGEASGEAPLPRDDTEVSSSCRVLSLRALAGEAAGEAPLPRDVTEVSSSCQN